MKINDLYQRVTSNNKLKVWGGNGCKSNTHKKRNTMNCMWNKTPNFVNRIM